MQIWYTNALDLNLILSSITTTHWSQNYCFILICPITLTCSRMEHEIVLIKVIVQYRVLEVLKLFLFLTTWTYRNMVRTLPSGRAFAMGTCHGFWGWEWTNYIIYTASSTSWSSSMLEALQGYGFQAVSPLFIFKRFIIHCLQFGFRFHLLKKK